MAPLSFRGMRRSYRLHSGPTKLLNRHLLVLRRGEVGEGRRGRRLLGIRLRGGLLELGE